MIRLKQFIEGIINQAVSRAFPITEPCSVEFIQSSCDYQSSIPNTIFKKYKTGLHTFGLFNSREIGDCIFVNCSKNEIVRAVQVSGLGDLQIFINDDYMLKAINTILSSEILFENLETKSEIYCHLIKDLEELNTLSYTRAHYLLRTLQKINKGFGVESTIFNFIMPQKDLTDLPENSFILPVNKDLSPSSWLKSFHSFATEKKKETLFHYIFKYYNRDFFHVPEADSLLYGDIFTGLNGNKSVKELKKTFNLEEKEHLLIYHLLKSKPTQTIFIKPEDLLARTRKSIYLSLSLFDTLHPTQPNEFSKSELNTELRSLFLHILSLPETLYECRGCLTALPLITWIEQYSTLHVTASPTLPEASLAKLETLTQSTLSFVFSLLSIRLSKLHTQIN